MIFFSVYVLANLYVVCSTKEDYTDVMNYPQYKDHDLNNMFYKVSQLMLDDSLETKEKLLYISSGYHKVSYSKGLYNFQLSIHPDESSMPLPTTREIFGPGIYPFELSNGIKIYCAVRDGPFDLKEPIEMQAVLRRPIK
eukprot:NODE_807_length_3783_cov_0.538002.p6 type:complete len:139 gc:universal NODE_807_length_3783_cov_0.538002:2564-2148(-)